jgi:hypothetical protein
MVDVSGWGSMRGQCPAADTKRLLRPPPARRPAGPRQRSRAPAASAQRMRARGLRPSLLRLRKRGDEDLFHTVPRDRVLRAVSRLFPWLPAVSAFACSRAKDNANEIRSSVRLTGRWIGPRHGSSASFPRGSRATGTDLSWLRKAIHPRRADRTPRESRPAPRRLRHPRGRPWPRRPAPAASDLAEAQRAQISKCTTLFPLPHESCPTYRSPRISLGQWMRPGWKLRLRARLR